MVKRANYVTSTIQQKVIRHPIHRQCVNMPIWIAVDRYVCSADHALLVLDKT